MLETLDLLFCNWPTAKATLASRKIGKVWYRFSGLKKMQIHFQYIKQSLVRTKTINHVNYICTTRGIRGSCVTEKLQVLKNPIISIFIPNETFHSLKFWNQSLGVILNHSTGQALDPDDLPKAGFEARQPHLASRHPVAGGPSFLWHSRARHRGLKLLMHTSAGLQCKFQV